MKSRSRSRIASRSRSTSGLALWLLPFAGIGLLLPLFTRLLPTTPGTLAWMLDLAAHWQILYAIAWLALCLIAAFRAKRWLLLAPLALLPLWTASTALPKADGGTPTLSVAVANVHVSNRDPTRLVAWLRAQPADVLILNELSPAYADALIRAIGDLYPYRAFVPDDSPFGIGLMARMPLSDIDVQRSVDDIPALSARIDVGGKAVRIVAVHPVPPLAIHWHDERDQLLRRLATLADRMPPDGMPPDRIPLIVAGDLNATPWSMALSSAAQRGLLRATGLSATWSHPSIRMLGIPIDHVLASHHWYRGQTLRGPEIGSDHRPTRAELHWAPVLEAP